MATQETRYSPLPWSAVDNVILDADGSHIATIIEPELLPFVDGYDEAQAMATADSDLIVRACNSHADLLAIVEQLAEWGDHGDRGPRASSLFDDSRTWREVVRSALAKAGATP